MVTLRGKDETYLLVFLAFLVLILAFITKPELVGLSVQQVGKGSRLAVILLIGILAFFVLAELHKLRNQRSIRA